MSSELIQRVIESYGGDELWKRAKYIEAEVSTKGLAFTLKRRPCFDHAKLFMKVDKPFCKITPVGKGKDLSGVLDGADVRLENLQGKVIAKRKNARDYFTFGRRLLYWDDLDMAYFANYAFWNYFTFPALLMNDEIVWEQLNDFTLQATFPSAIPTHSKKQLFIVNEETALLRQHNYTAEIISKFAQAANEIIAHKQKDSLAFPSLRRVTPSGPNGRPLTWPLLIEIVVHDFNLLEDRSCSGETKESVE